MCVHDTAERKETDTQTIHANLVIENIYYINEFCHGVNVEKESKQRKRATSRGTP